MSEDPMLQQAERDKQRFSEKAAALRTIPVEDPFQIGDIVIVSGVLYERLLNGLWRTGSTSFAWDMIRDRMSDHPGDWRWARPVSLSAHVLAHLAGGKSLLNEGADR